MIQTRTTSYSQEWNAYLRIKVGQSVTFNNATWANKTGINSTPSYSSNDWEVIVPEASIGSFISIGNSIFRLIKNPINSNVANVNTLEVNDFIANGFINNTTYCSYARYNGGTITDFGSLANDYKDGSYTLTNYQTTS